MAVITDVGGGYSEAESGLSKLALQWMLTGAELAGLIVDPQRKAEILGGKFPYVAPDPTGLLHKSLHGFWWLAEIWPKVVRIRQAGPGDIWKSSIRVNLARPRSIPTGSLVHTSVEQRINAIPSYRPVNLGPASTIRQRFQIVND